MAYTTIDDPSAHFQTALYTGNATQRNITNDGNSDLQPDWVWIKCRSAVESHMLYDSSRGVTKDLRTDSSNVENTNAQGLQTFNSDGFQIGTLQNVNFDTKTMVAWQWKANGGTTSSNSNGSITSTVQVNDEAGFSIVLYTGNETAGETIGHGLSAAPDVIICKNRDTNRTWLLGHQAFVDGGNSENLRLNSTGAVASADNQNGSGWYRTAFTSSTFRVGSGVDGDFTSSTNNGTDDHIAYCFAEKQGYSKFGSYTGNGSTDGAFVYLGFKPAWIMVKATDVDEWRIYDHKRANAFNVINVRLKAHTTAAESQDDNECDFLSNGVKWRSNSGGVNSDGQKYIYMAFAEHPFVSSKGVPVTAR